MGLIQMQQEPKPEKVRDYRHQITMEQASELLGIKASNFSGLEQKILMD